jgi:translation initiation factor 2B subunit (eIF-2B alpha/beta/delta family)
MPDTKEALAADLENVQTELDKVTESAMTMRGALRIIVKNCRDADMAAVAQAALDLDEHGADACAQMRGDGDTQQ